MMEMSKTCIQNCGYVTLSATMTKKSLPFFSSDFESVLFA